MKAFDSYRLHITPLSPIHIGTGESYEPTNYVIEDGVLHEFDTGAVMAVLTPDDRKKLLDIVNRRPDTKMILAAQKFFSERSDQFMPWAIGHLPVAVGASNIYAERIGKAAQIEGDGRVIVNELTIDRTSYNPLTRLPMLFGSSVKGAIRTALLDNTNNGKPLSQRDDSLFDIDGLTDEEKKRKRREQRKVFPRLNERLFEFSAGKFELDPMRLVQISDAAWQGEPGVPAAQVYLAVNRKKKPVRDKQGNLRRSRAEAGDLYQILECVLGWHYRAFSAQLNLQSVDGVRDTDRKGQRRLPTSDLRFDAARIARACNDFYMPILEAEARLMRERGYLDPDWDKTMQQLLAVARETMQLRNVFFLRVGRHSGAESVTINGVRHIKILEGTPEYQSEAKTLWLAADEKDQSQNLLPFGWLLVEFQSLDSPAPEWPELQAACELQMAGVRELAAKLADQRVKMTELRARAETKRWEEEERARLQARAKAEAAALEADRQARLATMSPNLRRVENFIGTCAARVEELRGGKERLNADFHNRARQLAREALESSGWTAEERRAAAEAIEQWLPKVVEKIDKDQLKKLKLGALRGGS